MQHERADGVLMTLFADWCAGYMTGVGLDREGWRSLLEGEGALLLHTMLMYGTEEGCEALERNPPSNAEHEARADALADEACAIRDYWFSLRVVSAAAAAPWRRRRPTKPATAAVAGPTSTATARTEGAAARHNRGKLRTRAQPTARPQPMPEIVFKGKEYVYNHHLGVPYRPLVPDAAKSVGEPNLAGNLIVHGDNLHALKSLLPRYAGQVDLIFIDPPYNTGNEGWCYSDNVNSPIMREWLSTNPVDGDDMLRHDKWLCMMWLRLTLLRELLSERGSIWITLDDNECTGPDWHLTSILAKEFRRHLVWQKRTSRENRAVLSPSIDHVLVYAKALRTTGSR